MTGGRRGGGGERAKLIGGKKSPAPSPMFLKHGFMWSHNNYNTCDVCRCVQK